MKNRLMILLFLLGLSCQLFGQTPAKGFDGSWQGTLEAAGTKLRIALIVTKSDAGVYTGKFDSLDQGATIPIDAITVNNDAVRLDMKSAGILYEGVMNKERTELTGTFTQGGQGYPLTFTRGEQTAASAPVTPTAPATPAAKPKPDYSAPADAPYTAENVLVKTPAATRWLER